MTLNLENRRYLSTTEDGVGHVWVIDAFSCQSVVIRRYDSNGFNATYKAQISAEGDSLTNIFFNNTGPTDPGIRFTWGYALNRIPGSGCNPILPDCHPASPSPPPQTSLPPQTSPPPQTSQPDDISDRRGGKTAPQPTIAETQNGTYYALVIGINQYRPPLPHLKTAVNDAQAIARILSERYGFQVKLLLDGSATRSNILDAMNQYRRTLGSNDNLLIYYAGHGHRDPDADKAYWLPADAESDSNSNWIIADELTTDIRIQPARHVLVISDSCYSGGLTREVDVRVRPDDQQVFLRKMLVGKSRTLMASGGDEPVSDAGANGHSVFADALLRGLEQIDGNSFTAGDLFHSFIQRQVAGKSDQVPRYSSIRNSNDENGDFVFDRQETSAGRRDHSGALQR